MDSRYIDDKKSLNDSLKQKGFVSFILSSLRVVYRNYIKRYLGFLYFKTFRQNSTFIFNNKKYKYFYHHYNFTHQNERCVEIAIATKNIKDNKNKRILEVGNVISHYTDFSGDILDKYEKSKNVINQDAIDFEPKHKYDLIISISTLEHIGRDDGTNDPDKIVAVLDNLRNCLTEQGHIIFTVPIAYNKNLDKYIKEKILKVDGVYYLKRVSKNNKWIETSAEEAYQCKYNNPYKAGNAICVGYIKAR
jgi:hypothetical protein